MIHSSCIQKIMKFPGGEIGVTIDPAMILSVVRVTAHIQSSDDLVALLMVVDAIRRVDSDAKIHLTMPYIPYARQDRVCNVGESLSISVLASIINSCDFESVTVLDPHSNVSTALIRNVKIVEPHQIFGKIRSDWSSVWVVAPDLGATKRAESFATFVGAAGVVQCMKTRELKTGKLSGFKCLDDVSGKNLLVLDDICDGGGTFIGLSQILKDADRVELAVTHGIFSKGICVVEDCFDVVYTTNSFSGKLISGKRTHCIDIGTII